MVTKQTVVMGLSGGMDSSTLLGYFLNLGYHVDCCLFTYGAKHNPYENKAARDVIQYYQQAGYNVYRHDFDFSRCMDEFNSALLLHGDSIPEGHYNDESMRKTVVPGRNLIFASLMAGLAESLGIPRIAFGMHEGDHYIYPDCRKEFIKALDSAVYLSSGGKVEVVAPFLKHNKYQILLEGYAHANPVPYNLTRTCYKDQKLSCGKCGSCTERLEAFKMLKRWDPIQYELGIELNRIV